MHGAKMYYLYNPLFTVLLFAVNVFGNGKDIPLGITLDRPSAVPGQRLVRYSSKITINVNNVWQDIFHNDERAFSQVVKDAYWQMNERWLADGIDPMDRPYVMTGLLVGSELYLSSSLKGGEFIYYFGEDHKPYVF